MRHRFNDRNVVGLFLLFYCLTHAGCERFAGAPSKKYRETQMVMGTIVHLDVCQDPQNSVEVRKAYAEAWSRLNEISWRMNVWDDRSDVAKINSSQLKPVTVGADTHYVLDQAIRYSKMTDGAFDISVWPFIKLWKDGEKHNQLPAPDRLQEAKKAVGPGNIHLSENNVVQLLNENTKIDLGGIAKGYAADEAARIFRKYGLTDFYIDAGGNIYVGGLNCSKKLWQIGIRDPRNTMNIVDIVSVSNVAVVTSGNYEQFYDIQNERWSHIIDPKTGYPQKEVISATMIAPTAIEADAFATALCVMGASRATRFIEELAGPYASLVIVRQGSTSIKKYPSQSFAELYHQ